MIFYFGYGANLNVGNMLFRCPNAKPVVKMVLPNYRLVFRGVADIEPAKGEEVQGAIWTITDKCEKALDRFEGFPHLYRKEYFTIKMTGQLAKDFGKTADVMYYTMNSGEYDFPTQGYYSTIYQGYKDWNLDIDSLDTATQLYYAYK